MRLPCSGEDVIKCEYDLSYIFIDNLAITFPFVSKNE